MHVQFWYGCIAMTSQCQSCGMRLQAWAGFRKHTHVLPETHDARCQVRVANYLSNKFSSVSR